MKSPAAVAVIGAGPAGCAAALEACRAGAEPVLLFDRSPPGRPKACGSGLSPRARGELERQGMWRRVGAEAYPVRGLHLTCPGGRALELFGPEAASVLARERLDPILLRAAREAGAQFVQTEVHAVRGVPGALELDTSAGPVRASFVVAADGARNRFGLRARRPRLLHGAVARFQGADFVPHRVEMIYQKKCLPHYGWLFPEDEHSVNIGLCVSARRLAGGSLRRLWQELVEVHFSARLRRARAAGPLRFHPIACSAWPRQQAMPGLLLAGEAAHLCHPATGEGIYQALLSGRLAGRAAARLAQKELSFRQARAWYLARLRLALAPGAALGEIFLRLGVARLDALAALAGQPLAARGLRALLAGL